MKIPTHYFKDIPPFLKGVLLREYNLLIWQSRGGLGKTYTIKQNVPEEQRVIVSGHVTPLKLYWLLSKNPNKIFIFDDVHSLLRNKTIIALMLQAFDLGEDKLVSYSTSAKYHGENVPRQITVNTQGIILCNTIPSGDATYQALLTRACHVDFNPSNKEVLDVLGTFAQDKEIYNWIKSNEVHFTEPLNFRIQEWGEKFKRAGQDWRDLLTKQYKLNSEFKFISEHLNRPYKEAVKAWCAQIGKSESTYKRRLAEYKKTNKIKE